MADEFRVTSNFGATEHGHFFQKGKAVERAKEVAKQIGGPTRVWSRDRDKSWQEWIGVKIVMPYDK